MPTPQQILDAAADIYRAEGFDALSIRRVAEEVGVTPMALYHHFANKDALLDALVARGFEMLERRFADAVAQGSVMLRLRAGITAYREFALAEPRLFELMYLRPRPNVPSAPASLASTTSPAFGRLIESLVESMRQGLVRAGEPASTILLIWSTIHGLIALHFSGRFGGDDARFRAVYDAAVNELFDLLRPPGAGRRE